MWRDCEVLYNKKLYAFISNSEYADPVDIKKLKFIFSAIFKYSVINNKDIRELNILEVGCGKGGIALPLASLGCKVRAIDIDKNSITYIQALVEQKKLGI